MLLERIRKQREAEAQAPPRQRRTPRGRRSGRRTGRDRMCHSGAPESLGVAGAISSAPRRPQHHQSQHPGRRRPRRRRGWQRPAGPPVVQPLEEGQPSVLVTSSASARVRKEASPWAPSCSVDGRGSDGEDVDRGGPARVRWNPVRGCVKVSPGCGTAFPNTRILMADLSWIPIWDVRSATRWSRSPRRRRWVEWRRQPRNRRSGLGDCQSRRRGDLRRTQHRRERRPPLLTYTRPQWKKAGALQLSSGMTGSVRLRWQPMSSERLPGRIRVGSHRRG